MDDLENMEQVSSLEIENIGGIDHYDIEFGSGISLLAGENATNRTSILQAIAGVCGSNIATLNANSEEGFVKLSIDGETYTRKLVRSESGKVLFDGEPYLEDSTAADLFAFLLADNETRQTVVSEGDIREIVMKPVDLGEIKQEVRQLRDELTAVDEQLERRDDLKNERLPDLRARRDRLQTEFDELSSELEQKREELEAADQSVAESQSKRTEVEETLSSLQETRSEFQNVTHELDAEQESLQSAQQRLEELNTEIQDIELPDIDREKLRRTQSDLWDQKEQLNERIERLQTLIDFNEQFRSEKSTIFDAIETAIDADSTDDQSRAERLARRLNEPDQETLICWTCGQQTQGSDIDETINALTQYQEALYDEYETVNSRIDEVETKLEQSEQQESKRDRLIERREQTEREIERTERTIESLKDRKSSLSNSIEELEDELSNHETEEEYQRVINLHKEVNKLQVERDSLQGTLEELEEEIDTVEEELSDLDDLEKTRSHIEDELHERRTRIDRLEKQTIEAFNDHMESLLDQLNFENIERVWLERKRQDETGGIKVKSKFDLHVVRSQDDGTVFEDTVRHLSESESQVVALVFALAGNLAHEVHKQVPFMLLDSIEMIDAVRKARLLDYFSGYHSYLVAVVLEEELMPVLEKIEPEDVIEVNENTVEKSD